MIDVFLSGAKHPLNIGINRPILGFGLQDQSDLAKLALEAKRSGVHILLSNSACPTVRTLYADPSFKIVKVNMRRNVNCDAGKRSPVREYLIW